jgi:hypothetical protein
MHTGQLDKAVADVAEAKDRWARLALDRKIHYLGQLKRQVLSVAEPWVAAAVRAKGIRPDSQLAGEEWISGPYPLLSEYAPPRVGPPAADENWGGVVPSTSAELGAGEARV